MDDQQTREAAADLIDGALKIIGEQGWCQNTLKDEKGRVCLLGAMDAAGGSYDFDVVDVAYAAVEGEKLGWRLHHFNDHPETSVEDVSLTLKKASASLREVMS